MQRFDQIPNRRTIIDRRRVAEALNALVADNKDMALRRAATTLLRGALNDGRAEIATRLSESP